MEAALDSYLVLCELTGLQYFSLKSLTCDNFKDPPSIFRTIYMFVLIGVVSFLMYVYIFVDKASVSGVMTSNILMRAIINSLSIGLVLVVSVSLVQSYLLTRATKKIFYNVNQIAEISLDQFGIKVNYKRIKASIWRRGATMIIFFVVSGDHNSHMDNILCGKHFHLLQFPIVERIMSPNRLLMAVSLCFSTTIRLKKRFEC